MKRNKTTQKKPNHLLGQISFILFLTGASFALNTHQDLQQVKPANWSRRLLKPIIINLDLPPSERLNNLHEAYAEILKVQEPILMKKVTVVFGNSKTLFKMITKLLRFIYYMKTNSEMFDEIQSISKKTGVDISLLMLTNYYYDLINQKLCTTIVARSSQGEVLFASNLDFSFPEELGKLAFYGNFMKNGETVFLGQGLYGLVGVLRGTVPGKFSVAINQRPTGRSDAFRRIFFSNAFENVYFLRKVLETQKSYVEAKKMLETAQINSYAYYVIAGVSDNEGAVIERNNDSIHDEYFLSDKNWFLVQSNYDRDQPDNPKDPRRTAAEKKLRARGPKDLALSDLDKILKEYPNHQITERSATITTVLARNDENNEFTVYVWDHPLGPGHRDGALAEE